MNIFEVKNFKVVFSPQALMLKPFREIWDLDPSKEKEIATAELSYVYYMCDDRSDYQYVLDAEERHDNIVKEIDLLGSNWIKGAYIDRAMDFYRKSSETTTTRLLRSTRGVIDKISHFLDVVDVNERDKNNKPVFLITQIVTAVEKIPKLAKALNEIEREVVKEKAIKTQSGNRTAGAFDDLGI
tara:strand:- start:8553 stop:9104 length:552 start_codon:yes stop_codon:yes gene_type:complete